MKHSRTEVTVTQEKIRHNMRNPGVHYLSSDNKYVFECRMLSKRNPQRSFFCLKAISFKFKQKQASFFHSFMQANEMLLLGRKLTAKEAFDSGLVSDVFLDSEFQREVQKRLTEMASLPPKVEFSSVLLYCVNMVSIIHIHGTNTPISKGLNRNLSIYKAFGISFSARSMAKRTRQFQSIVIILFTL